MEDLIVLTKKDEVLSLDPDTSIRQMAEDISCPYYIIRLDNIQRPEQLCQIRIQLDAATGLLKNGIWMHEALQHAARHAAEHPDRHILLFLDRFESCACQVAILVQTIFTNRRVYDRDLPENLSLYLINRQKTAKKLEKKD